MNYQDYNNNDINIEELRNNIQNNILIIEEKGYNQDLLDAVARDFKILYDCLTGLLITNIESYFGYFLINLKFKINFYEKTIAAVCLDDEGFSILFNPLLIGKCKLSEIVFIICHEIYHLMLGHLSYDVKINPKHDQATHVKLNYATDAEINDTLIKLSNDLGNNNTILTCPDFVVTSRTIQTLCPNTMVKDHEHFLYYYNLIKDNEQIGGKPSLDKLKEMIKKFLGSDGSNENEKYRNGSREIITSKNYGDITINDFRIGSGNDDFIDDELRSLLEKVRKQIEASGRGNVPLGMLETLERLNKKPQITWKQVFKKYLATIPSGYRRAPFKLNRRQPERVEIKGKTTNREVNVIVAVDTSGSMDKNILSKCFDEIFGMLKNHNSKITVIECDAKIQKVFTAKTPKDIDLNINGRGGTCFTPVIEYLNEHKEYRNGLLVYFTDGDGEDVIPKPILYRVMWVVADDNPLSVEKPYGEVVHLKTSDYKNII